MAKHISRVAWQESEAKQIRLLSKLLFVSFSENRVDDLRPIKHPTVSFYYIKGEWSGVGALLVMTRHGLAGKERRAQSSVHTQIKISFLSTGTIFLRISFADSVFCGQL